MRNNMPLTCKTIIQPMTTGNYVIPQKLGVHRHILSLTPGQDTDHEPVYKHCDRLTRTEAPPFWHFQHLNSDKLLFQSSYERDSGPQLYFFPFLPYTFPLFSNLSSIPIISKLLLLPYPHFKRQVHWSFIPILISDHGNEDDSLCLHQIRSQEESWSQNKVSPTFRWNSKL